MLVQALRMVYNKKYRRQLCLLHFDEEVHDMALSNLADWAEDKLVVGGTACGASDDPAKAPAACGAGDKPEEKPAACGSACGAGDK